MLIRALLAMPDVAQIDALAEPWRRLYSHSTLISTLVLFGHVAGLVAGGGLALAADRATLGVDLRDDAERRHHLAELMQVHRTVMAALGVTFVSGVLLFLADVEVFATSRIFWAKMALIALLAINLAMMIRVERELRGHPVGGTFDSAISARDRLWRRRRSNAVASVVLWFVLVFTGTALASH
ncbi:MAG: hypothetical protein ABIP93_14120 [Gemmatimonadaceae bacterium]